MPAERGSWPINSDGEVRDGSGGYKFVELNHFFAVVRLCALTARGFQQGIGYLHKPVDTGRKIVGIRGEKEIRIDFSLTKST